jgi:four helix bundle protein
MAQSFRDLVVWNRAIDLTALVYALSADFPKSETYGLSSQMRRAAVSIASNIAEGSARGTRRDFRHFVLIARGSNCELQTQLVITTRMHFAANEKVKEAESVSHEVGRMLSGLADYLTKPPKSQLTTDN